MAREFIMQDGGRVLVLRSDEGLIEHMARGECVIGVMSDVMPPPLMSGCYLVEDEAHVEASFVEKVYARYCHEPWMIGTGSHIFLRELIEQDYEALYGLEQELTEEDGKDVSSLLGLPIRKSSVAAADKAKEPPEKDLAFERREEETGRQRLKAYIDQCYPFYEIGLWAIIEKETQRLVGICGFSDTEDGEWMLGYHVAKAFRGRHYATQACELALKFAMDWKEMPQVSCLISPGNAASISVAEHLGFENKGLQDDGRICYQKQLLLQAQEHTPLARQLMQWFTKVAGKYFRRKSEFGSSH